MSHVIAIFVDSKKKLKELSSFILEATVLSFFVY